MNTLTIVNKFCAHNNFMPVELYSFNGGDVIVKYDKETSNEFSLFIKKLDRSTIKNNGMVNFSIVSYANCEVRIKGGK